MSESATMGKGAHKRDSGPAQPQLSSEQRQRLARRLAQPHQSEQLVVTQLRLPAHSRDPQQDLANLIAAHPQTRVWVPLLIGADCDDGEIATFSLAAAEAAATKQPDGIVAFTDPEELLRAFPSARPQQLGVVDVIRRALMSGGALRLDNIVLPSVACAALAVGDNWLAAWNDTDLRLRLKELCERFDLFLLGLEAQSDGATLARVGASANQRDAVVKLVGEINTSELIAARCGQLRLQLLPLERA